MPGLLSISLPKAAPAEKITQALKLIVRFLNEKQKAPGRSPGLRMLALAAQCREGHYGCKAEQEVPSGGFHGRGDPFKSLVEDICP